MKRKSRNTTDSLSDGDFNSVASVISSRSKITILSDNREYRPGVTPRRNMPKLMLMKDKFLKPDAYCKRVKRLSFKRRRSIGKDKAIFSAVKESLKSYALEASMKKFETKQVNFWKGVDDEPLETIFEIS